MIPANVSTMSADELTAAARTLTRVLGCTRLQGAFLDRQVARGDLTWTRARVASSIRKFLRAVDTELASRV